MTNKERKKLWMDYGKAMVFYTAGVMKYAFALPEDDNPAPTTQDDTSSGTTDENPKPPLPPVPPA